MVNLKKIKTLLPITLVLAMFIATTRVAHAATVTMSLSPSTNSVQAGSNFTVNVNLELGSSSTLDAVANVNFDSSKLQYVSASYAPSASWGRVGPDSGPGNGFYKLDVITNGDAQTGNLTLVTLTFRALTSTGSTSLSISEQSVSDGSAPPPATHNVNVQGTSIRFIAGQQPVSPSDATSIDIPAGAPSEEELQSNAEVSDEEPVPVAQFSDETGYFVEILVLDSEGNQLSGIEVKLNEESAQTNENGIASFSGITVGTYTISANGTSQEIEVIAGDPNQVQSFTLTEEASNLTWRTVGLIACIVAFILSGVYFVIKLIRNRRNGIGDQSSDPDLKINN